MAILGSSNWTTPSSDTQLEHNLFTTDASIVAWSREHFDRKWLNLAPSPETQPFVPLPPHIPQLVQPASGAAGQGVNVTLVWNGWPWAHKYDLFLGTNPAALTKVLDDRELGPYQQSWTPAAPLSAGTTYYWRVVGRTMANVSRSSPTCSFSTGTGGAPPSSTCNAPPAQPQDPVAVNEPQDSGHPTVTTPSNATQPNGVAPTPTHAPARRMPDGAILTGTNAVPRSVDAAED